jgi:hypothetical protein
LLTLVGDDEVFDTGVNRRERVSTVSLSADTQTIEARFAGIRSADADPGGGSTATYLDSIVFDVVFYVQAEPEEEWEIAANFVVRAGLVVIQEDGGGGSIGIGATPGRFLCTVVSGGDCGSLLMPNGTFSSGVTDLSSYVWEDGTTIVGIGPEDVQLRFTYQLSVRSVNGGEASILLGIPGTLTGMSADNYPGIGNRDASEDGHFVTVSLVGAPPVVPTTGAMGLVALGALVLGAGALGSGRRRAASLVGFRQSSATPGL